MVSDGTLYNILDAFSVNPKYSGLWLLRIFPKSLFVSKCSWKKRSSYQGKKEVARIVSKPLVSCLWGCGESVNPVNIQEVLRGALSSRQKEDPGFATFVKSHPWIERHNSLSSAPMLCLALSVIYFLLQCRNVVERISRNFIVNNLVEAFVKEHPGKFTEKNGLLNVYFS